MKQIIQYLLIIITILSTIQASFSSENPFLYRIHSLQLDYPQNFIGNLAVRDDTLIATTRCKRNELNYQFSSGLVLFDVSDIYNPRELQSYKSDAIGGYAIDDSPTYSSKTVWPYVYLPSESRLEIIDIENPENPVLVGTYTPNENRMNGGSIWTVNQKALLSPRYGKVELLDISDPVKAVRKSFVELPGNRVIDFEIGDDAHAFLLIATQGQHSWEMTDYQLCVLDWEDMEHPRIVHTISFPETTNSSMNIIKINKFSHYLYTTVWIGGLPTLKIYDVSTPASPVKTQETQTPFIPGHIVPIGDYFISIDNYKSGLAIYEMDGLIPKELHRTDGQFFNPVWNGKSLITFNALSNSLCLFRVNVHSFIPFFNKFD